VPAINDTGVKVCTQCGLCKPFNDFYRIPTGRPMPACKSCHKAYVAERYRSNPEVRASVIARSTLANIKASVRRSERAAAKYRDDKATRERVARNQRERYQRTKSDPLDKLRRAIGCGLRNSIRRNKSGRKCFDVVGYSAEELKVHLERQFVGSMCWENYGEWHIDHITPVSAFDFTIDPLNVARRVWALPNLRPLWKLENMKKHAKVTLLL